MTALMKLILSAKIRYKLSKIGCFIFYGI